MKYLASLLLVGFAFFATAQEEEPMTGPKISFTEKSHDFGDISQGEKVEHVFEFENVGGSRIMISYLD